MEETVTGQLNGQNPISDQEWHELVCAAKEWKCAALRALDAVQISENPPTLDHLSQFDVVL
jgi:hypothetical protein